MKRTKEYFKLLFEESPNIIFLNDIKGNIYEANKQAEDFLNLKKGELIGSNFFKLKLLSPGQSLLASARMAKLILNKGCSTYIYNINKKNSENEKLEISAQYLEIQSKDYFLCVARKTKGRKSLGENYQKEKMIFEQYIDITPAIMVVLNTDGNIIMANKSACKLLAYNEKELLGKNMIESFVPKDEVKPTEAVLHHLVKESEVSSKIHENNIITKQGEKRLIRWTNTSLRGLDGEIIGALSSGEDITEKRKSEEKISGEKRSMEIFQKSATGRELKMMELKKENKRLKKELAELKKK